MTQKTILITGTSTGIGHAAAELFAERGWKVLAGSRHPEKVSFARLGIEKVRIDVNDGESIDRFFADLSEPLDCVVNNAGYGVLLPFEDTPEEEIRKLFETNVFGLMRVCRHAVTMMRERRGGTIVNVSSILGTIGTPWYGPYCATKWAVEGFSESLAHEVAPFNVRIKIIEPGGTRSAFHHRAYDRDFPIHEEYKARYLPKKASADKSGYDSAESVAELIWQAANDASLRLRYGPPHTRKTLFWQRVLGRDGLWKRLHK